MLSNSPENFAKQQKAVIVAPAGCGKTELIADAVKCCNSRQLILTHTNAGVSSLRKRLKKKEVSSRRYHLETIHSFALRYSKAYPAESSILIVEPKTNDDYKAVITSAIKLFDSELIKKILKLSYRGIFVDEYQDCTIDQHKLILKLSENIPCRIVGDPLQGIFDFGTDKIVDWGTDVFLNFTKLDDSNEPWRWRNAGNKALGKWLLDTARPAIENKQTLKLHSLETIGCYWHPKLNNYCGELNELANKNQGDIFVISDPSNTNKPHFIAKNLKNRFRTIEPLTDKVLFDKASKIQDNHGIQRLNNVVKFATDYLTVIKSDCTDVKKRLSSKFKNENKKKLQELFIAIKDKEGLEPILELYEFFETYKPTRKRWQLWHEMKLSLKLAISEDIPLSEACFQVRSKTKYSEHRIPHRCLSRTVLLKGLECDCAAVIDADEMKPKDFYVAITRGSKELHIYSSNQYYPAIRCDKCNSIMLLKQNRNNGSSFLGCSEYPECDCTKRLP